MAQQRLPMRKIRDVLRLSAAGLSKRQIAAIHGNARFTKFNRARGNVFWARRITYCIAQIPSEVHPVQAC
jgi:hypothetical protein